MKVRERMKWKIEQTREEERKREKVKLVREYMND